MARCKVCTGCLACETGGEVVGYCPVCKAPVYNVDSRYEFESVTIHEDCLTDWAFEFFKQG